MEGKDKGKNRKIFGRRDCVVTDIIVGSVCDHNTIQSG